MYSTSGSENINLINEIARDFNHATGDVVFYFQLPVADCVRV